MNARQPRDAKPHTRTANSGIRRRNDPVRITKPKHLWQRIPLLGRVAIIGISLVIAALPWLAAKKMQVPSGQAMDERYASINARLETRTAAMRARLAFGADVPEDEIELIDLRTARGSHPLDLMALPDGFALVTPENARQRVPGELRDRLNASTLWPLPLPRLISTAHAETLELARLELAAVTPHQVDMPPAPPAWVRYAALSETNGLRPVIAIVIDDLGLSPSRVRQVADLPGPLTLSFLPYGHGLAESTRGARAAGHELMLHMPMQPLGRQDPGPGALELGLSEQEFAGRVSGNLSAFRGYAGVNNHMGSRLTADARAMTRVMAELKPKGLYFLDSLTSSRSVAGDKAAEAGLAHATRDVFIDHDRSPAAIAAALRQVERVARRQGMAIAIGHPHTVTINALAAWLPGLRARGFDLVPMSYLMSQRFCPQHPGCPAPTLVASKAS